MDRAGRRNAWRASRLSRLRIRRVASRSEFNPLLPSELVDQGVASPSAQRMFTTQLHSVRMDSEEVIGLLLFATVGGVLVFVLAAVVL